MDIRPQDLPELRAELAESLASPKMLWFFEGRSQGAIFRGWPPSGLRDLEVASLRAAELFYVAEPMAILAREAAKSLPRFHLAVEDLPARNGLAYLGGGAFPAIDPIQPAAAVHWAQQGNEVVFTLYADTELMLGMLLRSGGGTTPEQASDHRRIVGKLSPMAFEARIPFRLTEDEIPEAPADGGDLLIASIRSMWLLMQQPLAKASDAEPDRAAKRRLRRAGYEPKSVRVIELRRPASSGEHGGGESNYQHQWIVRGHWRNHWHPKREVHRPVWIAPHVKGPEGAPMIGGEKVYAWKR